jgi:peptidoglycan DL-endopeptidase CwlO
MSDMQALARIASIRSRFQTMPGAGIGAGGRLGIRPSSTAETGASSSSAFAQALDRATTSTAVPTLATGASATVLDWASAPTALPADTPFADLFTAAAQRNGLSPRLLAAVAQVESSFDVTAVSPAGAQGLMQFMPGTSSAMGVDPWDPPSAIDGAARLLAGHLQRFGSMDLALAAYNVGSGTVSRSGGQVPAAARGYVDKVFHLTGGLP